MAVGTGWPLVPAWDFGCRSIDAVALLGAWREQTPVFPDL